MYQQFFNFNTAPFSIAPDPHFIYMSEQHQEGLAHLLYGIKQGGGFVALTGEVGTGKTTLCHCLLKQLPDNVDIALVLNPKLNAVELLATICDELQIKYDGEKQSLKLLIDSLNHYLLNAHAKGRRTVLIIDEAQNLSLDVLEQVRLLTNLETRKDKLLQIILLGQPELKQILEKHQLRQLNQRITARYHLMPLSLKETRKYILHRLAVCGADSHIFNRAAIKQVYKLSNGIPRLINVLSDRSLLGAYATNSHIVNSKIVNKAATEIFNERQYAQHGYLKIIGVVLVLIAGGLLAINISNIDQPVKQHIILSEKITRPEQKVIKRAVIEPAQKTVINFSELIAENKEEINTAISQLAQKWGVKTDSESDCSSINKAGLHCLMDKADWEHLIALNRPVIMEFSNSEAANSYALLTGLKQGQPVFNRYPDKAFSLEQVLSRWNGYYLMVWQPPLQNINMVYPGQSSEAVLWIRKHLTEKPQALDVSANALFFDEALKIQVMAFQQQQQLTPDGIVGPRTFIHLKNGDVNHTFPTLQLIN